MQPKRWEGVQYSPLDALHIFWAAITFLDRRIIRNYWTLHASYDGLRRVLADKSISGTQFSMTRLYSAGTMT